MDYEVKLEIFEGPLDLLLHLIHKNEVDIFDIPIATITDQYLEYIDMMKALNIEVAGDFLIMASTLIHIKSKMLLPDLTGQDDGEDPRIEITRPLLEYMRFKELAGELEERELLDRDVFVRHLPSYLQSQMEDWEPRLDVNLFQLMDAFKRIIDEGLPGVQLTLQPERWSVTEKTEVIIDLLKEAGPTFFQRLFSEDRSLSELVVTFLAVLELVHLGLVKVSQPTHESDIHLVLSIDENGEKLDG